MFLAKQSCKQLAEANKISPSFSNLCSPRFCCELRILLNSWHSQPKNPNCHPEKSTETERGTERERGEGRGREREERLRAVSESELEMGYVGKHGVEALQRYKYSGVDKSYMAKYVFQPFWRYCVNFFPLWMPYVFFLSCLLPAPPASPLNPIFHSLCQIPLPIPALRFVEFWCVAVFCPILDLMQLRFLVKKGSGTSSLIWRIDAASIYVLC